VIVYRLLISISDYESWEDTGGEEVENKKTQSGCASVSISS